LVPGHIGKLKLLEAISLVIGKFPFTNPRWYMPFVNTSAYATIKGSLLVTAPASPNAPRVGRKVFNIFPNHLRNN
jgi:hypothetical protein